MTGPHVCKARRRRASAAGRRLQAVYVRRLLDAYRGVKAWFALIDRAVRYGIEQQLLLGRKPTPGRTPSWSAVPKFARAGMERKAKAASGVSVVDWLVDWRCVEHKGVHKHIGPHQVRVYGDAMGVAAELGKIKTPWNLRNRRAIEWAGRYVTPHMRDLVLETRAGLARLVRDGLDRGQSMRQVARGMRRLESFAMNPRQASALGKYRVGLERVERRIGAALAENNGNMAAAGRALRGKMPKAWIRQVRDGRFDVDGRVAKEAGRKVRYRAEMIARTEMARAVSEGTLEGYAEARVERIRWEAAADACDVCAGYDGMVYSLGEGSGLLPEHVNCRCVWVPETEAVVSA